MTGVLQLIVVTAILGPSVESEALEPVSVVVLPPDAASLPDARRDLVADTISAQISGGPVMLVEPAQTRSALVGTPPDCGADPDCRAEVASRTDAGFVVRAQVTEPRASDYAIAIELFDVASGETVAAFEDDCTICSEADLERIVRERTLDLREALIRHLAPEEEVLPPPVVEPVATTPTVVERVRTEVAAPSRLRIAGWSLVGAGAATTLGGIVLLALQGSDAGCPADPRGGPCIPLVYRTAVPGAITAGLGVAALGTGVALVVVGKRRDASKTTARVIPTGSGVSLVGRF